jgi:2'-5' RNA ligase
VIILKEELLRSFIAIDPGSQTLDQILTFQKALVDTSADVKLVEPENIHLTLRFLGEKPLSLINRISEALKALNFSSNKVSISGVGVFPNMRRINVIWVGINKGVLDLIGIYNQVESKLQRLGVSPDDRGFSPHITVARVRSARNKDKLVETLLFMREKEFGVFHLDSLKLKKSLLTPKGPVYTTLTEVKARTKLAS